MTAPGSHNQTDGNALTPSRRVEGLRNLRTGYDLVSAVGFWKELHGEDLIDVYAEAADALAVSRAREAKLEEERDEALTFITSMGLRTRFRRIWLPRHRAARSAATEGTT